MYYPALFATFPVDKLTIVKLSSGAPGTMTTAVEGNGVVPGGWWVFGWGKHFAVVTGTKAARAIHVALLHDLVVSSLRARAGRGDSFFLRAAPFQISLLGSDGRLRPCFCPSSEAT